MKTTTSKKQKKIEGPDAPGIKANGTPTGMKYRCPSCQNDFKEVTFVNTPEGDYCRGCVDAGKHLAELPEVEVIIEAKSLHHD